MEGGRQWRAELRNAEAGDEEASVPRDLLCPDERDASIFLVLMLLLLLLLLLLLAFRPRLAPSTETSQGNVSKGWQVVSHNFSRSSTTTTAAAAGAGDRVCVCVCVGRNVPQDVRETTRRDPSKVEGLGWRREGGERWKERPEPWLEILRGYWVGGVVGV